MCNFISAIVCRNGDILCDPEHTDSHEDLVVVYGLRDQGALGAGGRDWVRVEFIPPDGSSSIDDPQKWSLRVDEDFMPEWFNVEDVTAKMQERASRMIVCDDRRLILGGCWIVCGSASVQKVSNARIYSVRDSARVDSVCDSARVDSVRDSARVGSVYGSARVGSVYGSARVGSVYGSASVGSVRDSASVGSVYGSASVGSVYGSASVGSVRDQAKVLNQK